MKKWHGVSRISLDRTSSDIWVKSKMMITLILAFTIITWSCSTDEDPIDGAVTDYQYHAHIYKPLPNNKQMGDTIFLDVEFESHAGAPVHHVKISMYEVGETRNVYQMPENPLVYNNKPNYAFQDWLVLNESNGIFPNKDWVIEARVWGADENEGEEIQKLQFHVLP